MTLVRGVVCGALQVDVTVKGVFVTDLGSSNGTFVNGRQLASSKSQKLPVGAQLTLADQVLGSNSIMELSDD